MQHRTTSRLLVSNAHRCWLETTRSDCFDEPTRLWRRAMDAAWARTRDACASNAESSAEAQSGSPECSLSIFRCGSSRASDVLACLAASAGVFFLIDIMIGIGLPTITVIAPFQPSFPSCPLQPSTCEANQSTKWTHTRTIRNSRFCNVEVNCIVVVLPKSTFMKGVFGFFWCCSAVPTEKHSLV